MKKLLYAAIVAFLFVGGLAAGVVHKGMQKKGGGGGTIAADPGAAPEGGLNLADLAAETTPADGTTQATETLNLDGAQAATDAAATALAAAPTGADTMTDGRSFGGGSNPDPVKSSGGSSGSSSSSIGSSASDWNEPPPSTSSGKSKGKVASAALEPDYGGGEIPSNIDYGTSSSFTEEPAIEPVATPRKGKGKTVAAVAAVAAPPPSDDPFNEMPTVDDNGNAAAPDPFAEAPSAAPTADPFAAPAATPAPMMAMAMPAGGGDLVFGAASKKPALVKVAQKQNGANSVVMIQLAGSARYKIIQIPKRRQVWVDFEGVEVPGGGSSVGGSAAHVREISAKYFANENGGVSYARVIVQLDDGVLTTNDRGKEALQVTPAGGTGESSQVQLTIGAKGQQF